MRASSYFATGARDRVAPQPVLERPGFRTVNFTGLRNSMRGQSGGLERHRCYFECSPDFESYKGLVFSP
jgi:hypothetical protein